MDENQLLADQPLWEKLIKKGFWLYLFSFLVAPAGYIIKVLISNSVSVADVGVLYSIVWLITFLNVYNDLGLTESLQYFLPRYWIKKQYNYIKTSLYLSLFVQIFTAILIALFLWLWAPWLAQHYFHSPSAVVILKYFCFYFLGINLFQILQSIFIAFQNTFASQFVEFIKMRSVVWFTFLFFLTGRQTIEWYSLNRLLGLLIGILVAGILFYKNYKKTLLKGKIVFEKPMLKEYIKYALWCFIWMNVWNLFGQIIQQMIIVILGPESAGYYSNFVSLFSISWSIIGPIIWLIFPLVSEIVVKKNTIKLSLLYRFFYTYFLIFSLFLTSFFIVLGPEIWLVFFGKKFIFSWELLSWGALFTTFMIFVSFNFSVLAGMGKIKERVKMMFYSLIMVFFISLIWLSIIWIYWSILALWVWYVFLWWKSFRVLYRHTSFTIDWWFVIKNILLMVLLSFIIFFVKSKLFVINDLMRYKNLWNLIIVWFWMFIIFIWFNYKRALFLKDEIMKLRIK